MEMVVENKEVAVAVAVADLEGEEAAVEAVVARNKEEEEQLAVVEDQEEVEEVVRWRIWRRDE
jgi:hypothetical protein